MSGVAQHTDVRPHAAAYRATLFGPFHLTQADHSGITISNKRARAVLAMLCVEPGNPIDRTYLSKMLWPGRFEAHAKASLRQCVLELGKLRGPCGTSLIATTRNAVALNSEVLRTDLDEFEACLNSGDYALGIERLTTIGARPVLDQMAFGDAFDEWLSRARIDCEMRLRTTIQRALIALDAPSNADLRACLLAAWAARGPSASTVPVSVRSNGKRRIAVLPFQALGSPEGADYFADGVAEELITSLGQVPQLVVAGRTSSFHFRNSTLAAPEIADQLRVSHLIEGAVQKQGNHVRIHVHIINGEDGFEICSQRYDGLLDELFTLQETVAHSVTIALTDALGIFIQPPFVRGMTPSKSAYDLYLQGRSLCTRLFGDGVLDKAVELLDQAVALDPHFAQAWVALAEAYQMIATYTPCLDRPAASARMAECARRAIALMPDLGYPHSLLGVHQWTQNDIVGALDLAHKAYDLEPHNPAVAMRLGSFLLYCGRTRDGMKYVEEAIDRDPVDGRKFNLLSVGHFNQGRIQEGIEAGHRMVDLGFPSMWLGVAMAAAGEHEQAVEHYQRTRALMNKVMFPPAGSQPMPPEVMDAFWLVAAKGVCSGKEADRTQYCLVLDMLYASLHDRSDPTIVLPAIFMGYAEMLFRTVGERITPANTLCLLSIWADVDPIRQIWQHPEFIPFAQRIGMAAAWDKYGWPDLLPPPSNRV